MRYIRLIHPLHWHNAKKRFASNAFTNSSAEHGGGISVVDPECATRQSRSICAHVGRFYHKFPAPVILWEIDADELPTHTAEVAPTPEGDVCHLNIRGLTDRQAEKHFKIQQQTGRAKFLICQSDGVNPKLLSDADHAAWLSTHRGTEDFQGAIIR